MLRVSDSVFSAGGTTVNVCEIVTSPKVADTVTVVGCDTTGGTILNVRTGIRLHHERRRHRRNGGIAALQADDVAAGVAAAT